MHVNVNVGVVAVILVRLGRACFRQLSVLGFLPSPYKIRRGVCVQRAIPGAMSARLWSGDAFAIM